MSIQEEMEFPPMNLNVVLDFSDVGYLLEQRPTTQFELEQYHGQLLNLEKDLKRMTEDTQRRIKFLVHQLDWWEYGEPPLNIKDAE